MSALEDSLQPHISTLPDEILAGIQTIATHAHTSDTDRCRFPSILSRVSRRWWSVALSTPRIWSFIFINDEHTMGSLATRLARTGGVPLDIKIYDPHGPLQHDEVMKPLLGVQYRWISFNLETSQIKNFAPHFPGSLPLLQKIAFTDTIRQFNIPTLFPNLKYMTLSSSWVFWDPSVNFANLVEFRVSSCASGYRLAPERLIRHLQSTPRLEVLVLSHPWLFGTVSNEESQALLSKVVDLPQLRTLTLDSLFTWEFAMLLSCIRAPALKNLTVMVVQADDRVPDSPSINQLHLNFPSLQALTLMVLELSIDEIRHLILQVPKIHELALLDTGHRATQRILDVILCESDLTDIAEVRISGVPTADIYKCFSGVSVPRDPRSPIFRARWKLHRYGGYKSATAEENRFLVELCRSLPMLEVEN